MPSCQEYANRLREDAHRTLAPQVNDLEQELNNIKNDLSLSLGQLSEKLEAIRSFALPEAESVVDEALEEATRVRGLQLASLANFAHDVRRKETQEEILNLLLDQAVTLSSRVILFAVRGERLAGWSSRGFSHEIAEEISNCNFEQSASPHCQKALESESPTPAVDIAGDYALKFIREDTPGPWHFFPLRAVGRPVAILMAAAVEDHSCSAESLRILVTFTGTCIENIALRILHELRPQPKQAQAGEGEPLAAIQKTPEAGQGPVPEAAHAEAVTRIEPAPMEEQKPILTIEEKVAPLIEQIAYVESETRGITTPEPVAGLKQELTVAPGEQALETVEHQTTAAQEEQPAILAPEQAAIAPEEQRAEALREQPAMEPEPVPEQQAAPHQQPPTMAQGEKPAAARDGLPATSAQAETTAPAVDVEDKIEEISPQVKVIPLGPPPAPRTLERLEPPKTSLPTDSQRLAEETELHTAARRFARLLVSEIKLYNEQRVIDGRKHKDVYVRLKKDIDRSREMYDKRIPASVTRKNDYFHDEIVRILGENDPSALGSDYPGPHVEN